MKKILLLASAITLVACGEQTEQTPTSADQFFENFSSICGKSFAGNLVSSDEVDADFAGMAMVMHVRDCSENEIRIPFHVEDNRSRTWIISRTSTGLRLKHDHRHEDGEEDVVTMYGGDTATPGTENRQEFPADEFSKQLFTREGLDVSVDNVWAVEIHPGETYAYELRRPNRFFRVEFDLKEPIETPPPAWGHAE